MDEKWSLANPADVCVCGRDLSNMEWSPDLLDNVLEGKPFCEECGLPYLEIYAAIWELAQNDA